MHSPPNVHAFFDPDTWILTYLVWDPTSRDAVVIDPVLDLDPLAVQTATTRVTEVGDFVEAQKLKLRWVLETHAHADHLSGSQVLKQRFGAGVAIGAAITAVQEVFRGIFGLGEDFPADGSQFDRLLHDGEVLEAGALAVRIIGTPGHTPACLSFLVGDALFTGDALFMPDYGTGRCDFRRGSAAELYDSIQRLYALPADTRAFVGHDYQPGERELRYQTTIGASRQGSVQLSADTEREDFIAFRSGRDQQLRPPRLLFQSIQVNIRAGSLPEPEASGRRYLKLPIGLFD